MCIIIGKKISCNYLAHTIFIISIVCVIITICCLCYSWTIPREIQYEEIKYKPYVIKKKHNSVKYINFNKENYESII